MRKFRLTDGLAVMDEDNNLQENTDNAAVSPAPTFKAKRVQGGEATTDLILSAHVAGNAEVFPMLLAFIANVGLVDTLAPKV